MYAFLCNTGNAQVGAPCTIQELFVMTHPGFVSYVPVEDRFNLAIHCITYECWHNLSKMGCHLYFIVLHPGFINMWSILGTIHDHCVISCHNRADPREKSRELIV